MKHVWTINSNETVSCLFSGTRTQCRNFIVGRWGHWPPFAVVSQIECASKFRKRYLP